MTEDETYISAKEVFRSKKYDIAYCHRVIKEAGKFWVEFPAVCLDGTIDGWASVGGGPGQPSPKFNTLGEAVAFVEGLESGMTGEAARKEFRDGMQQRAYDSGLRFGLEI